jgi:hydrogenase expression/formation protein HypE
LFLSAAFIIEEGLSMEELRRVVASFRSAACAAGIEVVTGDTKVVERESGDGVFINTSGIGLVPPGLALSANQAQPGDRVLLSGPIGDHGIAIMAQREGLEFETAIRSDSAALHGLVGEMLKVTGEIRCMRDPTRGGLASALNEIAGQSQVGIELEESAIPIRDEVRGACEILGLDPMYVANEGKLIAIVVPEVEQALLQAMRGHDLGREAQAIGTVRCGHPGLVTMRTVLGTTRVVDMLAGDQLPRIC